HDAVARMHHLRAEPAAAQLAERAYSLPLLYCALELLQLAAVEIVEAQHQPLGMDDELPARAKGDLGAFDASFDLQRLAGNGRVGTAEDGLVLVAQRQVQDKVEAPAQSQLLELALECFL